MDMRRGPATLLRAVAVLLCLSLLTCVLVSCGKEESGFILHEEPQEPQVTLTFFGNINAASKMPALEALITEYMALHPEVNIVYEGIDPSLSVDYNTLLTKRLSTGNGDDIFFSYAGFLPTLVENGYLEPLDTLDSWSAFDEGEKEFLSSQGHYYGIPMERTVIGLYCNLDVLHAYALEPPETYEDFLQCCATLKDAGLTPIAASQLLPFSGYAYADGLARIYHSENTKQLCSELSDQTKKYSTYFQPGFAQLQKMLDLGYIDREAALSHDTTAQAEQAFADGQSAFLLGASDLNASIISDNPTLQYAVYPIPVSEGESVVLSAPDHLLCVNAAGAHKEIALDFVAFCTQRENIEHYVAQQGSVSPLAGSEISQEYLAPVAQLLAQGKALPSVNDQLTARLQNWVQQAGLTMLQGDTPAEAADTLDSLIPVPKLTQGGEATP